MSTAAAEALAISVYTLFASALFVLALRKRDWGWIVPAGVGVALGIAVVAACLHGVVFSGPGGHPQGSVSVP